MNRRTQEKIQRLIPHGIPKYIRCYDNGGPDALGGSYDRFTVIYTRTNDDVCHYVGMSAAPFHPQGICQHGEHDRPIDRPRYAHLGRPTTYEQLPVDCQRVVLHDYCDLHQLPRSALAVCPTE